MKYTSIIQRAILMKEKFKNYFPEILIVYHPRDIVSVDFYWVKKINNYKIIALADFTGYGIVGAMMSMLGISILNDINIELHKDSKFFRIYDLVIVEYKKNHALAELSKFEEENSFKKKLEKISKNLWL